jgi:hypothetical protein
MSNQESTPSQGKEPMIGQDQRPTPIDFNAELATLKVSEFLSLQWGEIIKVEKELHKPEKELFKPEKEFHKPEKEFSKPEKELSKPEWGKTEGLKVEKEVFKELLKPEGIKGEKELKPDPLLERLVDQVAARVVSVLKQEGVIK